MRMRILLFDDDQAVSSMLQTVFMMRGYETFAFGDPSACPVHEPPEEYPAGTHPCADVVIADVHMTMMNGFDFIKKLAKAGYDPENTALISGEWSDDGIKTVNSIGCRYFKKPFDFDELEKWLAECEARVSPERELSDWFRRT